MSNKHSSGFFCSWVFGLRFYGPWSLDLNFDFNCNNSLQLVHREKETAQKHLETPSGFAGAKCKHPSLALLVISRFVMAAHHGLLEFFWPKPTMDWRFIPLAGQNPAKRSWQEIPVSEPLHSDVASGSKSRKHDWKDLGTAVPGPSVLGPRSSSATDRSWKTIPVDGEAEQSATKKQKAACISASSWQELALSKSDDKKLNQYQVNGMDPGRITKTLAAGCGCKRNCLAALSVVDVSMWCRAFHMADETKRQLVLFSLYHPEVDWEDKETITGRQEKTTLEVSGVPICVSSFCRILGISRKRFYKLIYGEPDLRRTESGTKPAFCPQQAKVDEFFRDIYQSAAEPLAIGLHRNDSSVCVSWICLAVIYFFWQLLSFNFHVCMLCCLAS